MNIAFFVSPLDTVPITSKHILAPWYLAGDIVPELVRIGHVVTTYCALGSRLPGNVVTAGVAPCISQIETLSPANFSSLNGRGELELASRLFQDARDGRFDIIHIFQGLRNVLPFVPFVTTPVVCTFHDPFTQSLSDFYRAYGKQGNLYYTALSESQRKDISGEVPRPEVVYNGIPVGEYPFSSSIGSYGMTCGRIVPQKGHDDAVAAVGTTENLVIAGKYYKNDPTLYIYWLTKIFPAVDGKRIRYMPFTQEDSYKKLLAGAKALLFPIKWEEPFGMVMIEAMATGTPVIAYNRGSVAEVVRDGVTGFIIDPPEEDIRSLNSDLPYQKGRWVIKKQGIDGIVEAIKRISEINRTACRKHIEDHFTVEKMVEGYEHVYLSLKR